MLLKRVLSIKVILKVLIHVFKEKLNPKYKIRRSLIQPILGFDLFYKSLNKFNPQFTTFLQIMLLELYTDIGEIYFQRIFQKINYMNKIISKESQ